MIVVITGVPGTGKTAVSKALAKKTGFRAINEKDFCQKNGLLEKGKNGEFEVDLKRLEKKLKWFLPKAGNVFLEGHLLCDLRLKADLVVVLRASQKELQKRLEKRGYSDEKILDNCFAEENGYCLKNAEKNFGAKKTFSVFSGKSIKETTNAILKELQGRNKALKGASK